MDTAILFLVFNRPDTTRRVFEAIRAARPPRLYVAADGPRATRAAEAERCDEARRIATSVDWPCQVVTLFREQNLGCKRAVSSAISWFFEHEPEGIILEDDCLPSPSFFPYCDALLKRYRDEPRVMCISGDNFISEIWQPAESYYFSQYFHIWGWATWRRAWKFYDVDLPDWPVDGQGRSAEHVIPHPMTAPYWARMFDRVKSGRLDTWDYQWVYACWKQRGLSCMPRVNLISNIGFGADATHTISPESRLAGLPVGDLEFPLRHPESVEAVRLADDWTDTHIFGIRPAKMRWLRIRSVFNRAFQKMFPA